MGQETALQEEAVDSQCFWEAEGLRIQKSMSLAAMYSLAE